MIVSAQKDGFITLSQKKFYLRIMMVGFLCQCFLYGLLPQGKEAFPWFGGLFLFQFITYLGMIYLISMSAVNMRSILLIAIAARVILIFSTPILESDYWRYLWDGRVLANGVNPYRYTPMDSALDHLNISYRHLIDWGDIGTIYPPLSIVIFAFSHLIAPDSLIALKLVLGTFDFGTGILLYFWFQLKGLPGNWSALYFLNPLILKEVANSAHVDSIPAFFSILAVFLFDQNSRSNHQELKTSLFGWSSLAIAVASKLYPICFVPIFFKVDRWRLRGILIFFIIVIFSYIPFLGAGLSLLNGTQAFARDWIFNAGLYHPIEKLFSNDVSAKTVAVTLFIGFVFYRTRKVRSTTNLPAEALNIIGAILILSPVVNAWYVLWILPFACITRNIPWLSFSFLVVASYSWWYSQELAFYLRWFEYVLFHAVLLYWVWGNKERLAKRHET